MEQSCFMPREKMFTFDSNGIKIHLENHFALYVVMTVIVVFTIFVVNMGISEGKKYDETPTVEREVFSTIIINEYTECVFVIDEKRYTTNDIPCMYKMGEKVKTKLLDNSYKRITIID